MVLVASTVTTAVPLFTSRPVTVAGERRVRDRDRAPVMLSEMDAGAGVVLNRQRVADEAGVRVAGDAVAGRAGDREALDRVAIRRA